MEPATQVEAFQREVTSVKELFEAKLDTVRKSVDRVEGVLERVVQAVEKQAEQNIALAILSNRVAINEQNFESHKTAVNAALQSHSRRLDNVSATAKSARGRIRYAQAVIVGGLALMAEFCIHNFHEIMDWLHGV